MPKAGAGRPWKYNAPLHEYHNVAARGTGLVQPAVLRVDLGGPARRRARPEGRRTVLPGAAQGRPSLCQEDGTGPRSHFGRNRLVGCGLPRMRVSHMGLCTMSVRAPMSPRPGQGAACGLLAGRARPQSTRTLRHGPCVGVNKGRRSVFFFLRPSAPPRSARPGRVGGPPRARSLAGVGSEQGRAAAGASPHSMCRSSPPWPSLGSYSSMTNWAPTSTSRSAPSPPPPLPPSSAAAAPPAPPPPSSALSSA